MELRATARRILDEAMAAVRIDAAMLQAVRCADGVLHVGSLSYRLAAFERVVVVAMGKAAGPMAEALMTALRDAPRVEGVVVGATAPTVVDARLRWMRGSHPVPDAASVAAADVVLRLLRGCDARCLVLVLLSGGASSMVERPLDGALNGWLSAEDAADLHRALVASGLPIAAMNTLRKHVSAVKGGRLALAAGDATLCTVIVSDVRPGEEQVVGSGPTMADATTVEDCRRIVADAGESLRLTAKLRAYLASALLEETPKPGAVKGDVVVLLSSDDLCAAAQASAAALGFAAVVDNGCDEWEYRAAAEYLLCRAEMWLMEHERVCVVSTGEVAVALDGEPGLGGRNQQFALECARLAAERMAAERRTAERGLRVVVLSAGSDGVDGNSVAAGAVVDATTVERAAALGLSVEQALRRFDSYSLLAALGDAVVTGATGNNLRDLRLVLMERVPERGMP